MWVVKTFGGRSYCNCHNCFAGWENALGDIDKPNVFDELLVDGSTKDGVMTLEGDGTDKNLQVKLSK